MNIVNECSVDLINSMGSDLTVVDAARVSFDKTSEWEEIPCGEGDGLFDETCPYCDTVLSERDTKLINYLAKHGHWTPFAHPQIMIRETVPIFTARQRFKHVVGFVYNEISRRYVDDEPEFFVPNEWRGRPVNAKQGSSTDVITPTGMGLYTERLYDHLENSLVVYENLLEEGVAPEQARMVLPQNMMTSYYVTGSLAAWARAYNQRMETHAQDEIRDLALKWGGIIEPMFPVSWKALTDGS